MKLVTYEVGKQARVGVVEGEAIVDVASVAKHVSRGRSSNPKFRRAAEVIRQSGPPPEDMIDLLARGEKYLKALETLIGLLAAAFASKKSANPFTTRLAKARLRAPIPRPGKITCLGLNYADHAREQGIEPPDRPIYFLKSVNTICGPGDSIVLPLNSSEVDYEAELAVVIGKRGKNIPEEKAYEYVAGYMALHDVSARDMQFGDKQWFRGKSCDTFAPTGPWLVTRDEVPDPQQLRISLTLNGQTMQDSNTSNLIFKIPYLVSYLSQSLTWEVGDIISTGTPPGVGVFRKPPVFLKPGDTASITIEKIGTLTNPVVGPS